MSFHVPDGVGIRWLLASGVEVAWISGRSSLAPQFRARELGVKEVHLGISDKAGTLETLLEKHEIHPSAVAYVGDDLIDLAPMALVGMPVAVADAREEVRQVAVAVTSRPGGMGAVREVCEWILDARGAWQDILAGYASESKR